jgi:hypothetical protein
MIVDPKLPRMAKGDGMSSRYWKPFGHWQSSTDWI